MRRYIDEELEQKIEQVKRKTRKSKSQTVRAVNKKIEKAQEQLKQPGLSSKAKAAIAAGAAAFAGVALAALLKSASGQKAQPRPNAHPNNPQQEDIRNIQEVQRVFNAVARSVQSSPANTAQEDPFDAEPVDTSAYNNFMRYIGELNAYNVHARNLMNTNYNISDMDANRIREYTLRVDEAIQRLSDSATNARSRFDTLNRERLGEDLHNRARERLQRFLSDTHNSIQGLIQLSTRLSRRLQEIRAAERQERRNARTAGQAGNAQEREQTRRENERNARAFIQSVMNLSQSYEQLRRVWGEEGRDRDRAFRGFQSDFREANRLYQNTALMAPSLVTQDMIVSRNRFLEIRNWFNRNGRIAGSNSNRSGLDFDSKPRKDSLKRRIDSIVRREVAKHVCRVLDDNVRNKVRIIEQEASKLPDKTMGQKIKMKLRAIVDPTMHTKKKLAILGAILGGLALYRGQKNIRKAVGEIRQTLQANEKARENIRRNREEELRRIRQRSSEARHQMNEYFRERRERFGLNPQPSFSSHERRNGPRNFGSGPMDIDI